MGVFMYEHGLSTVVLTWRRGDKHEQYANADGPVYTQCVLA
jgi:hypothetical protein